MAVTRRQIWFGSAAAMLGAVATGKLLAQRANAFNPGSADMISGMGDEPESDASRLQLSDPPQPLPAIKFTDENGKNLTLDAYRGRGFVLNFWATWCVPCVEELPSLDALAAQLKEKNIPVLALSSDKGGADTVRHFYDRHGIRMLPVLIDPGMQAAHDMGARGIPTTILVDSRGRERARLEGNADWNDSRVIARIVSLIGVT